MFQGIYYIETDQNTSPTRALRRLNVDYLVLDTEATTHKKGNPFSERNKLCAVGLHNNSITSLYDIEHSESPYGQKLHAVQRLLSNVKLLVGFNIKYDLHWLRRYGIDFSHCMVWDCQLVEFILANQSTPYPSLDESCTKYSLGNKLDVVNSEYWSRGLNTTDVPWDTLSRYLDQDLVLTHRLYLRQLEVLPKSKWTLVNLHHQDLLVLQEMEYNGTKFDWPVIRKNAEETAGKLQEIDKKIKEVAEWEHFNANSPEHVSALLYGGSLEVSVGTPEERTYKSGKLSGQTYTRNRWETHTKRYPRLIQPVKGSDTAKENVWSVDSKVLRRIRGNKTVRSILSILDSQADFNKLQSTYYLGLPELVEEYDWKTGFVHGQLNQCVVRTGRLSSNAPNMQNLDGRLKETIVSRF